MLTKSLREQIKCRWREFLREPSACFWVVFMPVLWIVILGIAFSHPKPERYGVGILLPEGKDKIENHLLQQVEHALSTSPQVKLSLGQAAALQRLSQRGEVVIMVDVLGNEIRYQFDPSSPEAGRARFFVDALIQESQGRKNPTLTRDETIKMVGGRYVDFLIPGILGLSIMSSSMFGTGMTIVSNRKENLLKRYLATPMKKSEFLLSHVVGRFFVLAVEFATIVITGFLVFRFKIFGTFIEFFLFSILGASTFTALALACASRTKSIPVMGGFINLITIPSIMLSGVFFSKTNFPDALLPFLDLLPLTALNDGLRKIALEGVGLAGVSFEAMLLAIYTLLGIGLSRVLFKWY